MALAPPSDFYSPFQPSISFENKRGSNSSEDSEVIVRKVPQMACIQLHGAKKIVNLVIDTKKLGFEFLAKFNDGLNLNDEI